MICLRQAGTWDPLLQCLYLDKHLLRQQNTKKTIRDESNSMHAQLGQIMNKKTKKSNCHFGGVQIKKQGSMRDACTWHYQRGGRADHLHHLSVPTYPSTPTVFVQTLSPIHLFATSGAAARQTPLASTIAQSLLKFMSTESVLLSN